MAGDVPAPSSFALGVPIPREIGTGDHYYAGVDVGSVSTAAVVTGGRSAVLGTCIVPTGARCVQASETALVGALEAASLRREALAGVITTGYGRGRAFSPRTRSPNRTRAVTEVTCHGRGIAHWLPEARSLIDVGGQDCKAMLLAPGGRVMDFAMNDRCAAGTGRFFENMCRVLEVDLDEFGPLALSGDSAVTISHICAVFAESEVVGLLAQGASRADAAAALCRSAARQVTALARRVGLEEPVALSGGVARNLGFVKALEAALGTSLLVPPEPDLVGALGAALIAREGDAQSTMDD